MKLIFNVSKFFRSTEVTIDTDKHTFTQKGDTNPLFWIVGSEVRTSLPKDTFDEVIIHDGEGVEYNYYTIVQDEENDKLDLLIGFCGPNLPSHYLPWDRFATHKSLHRTTGSKTHVVESAVVDEDNIHITDSTTMEKEDVFELIYLARISLDFNKVSLRLTNSLYDAIGSLHKPRRDRITFDISLLPTKVIHELRLVNIVVSRDYFTTPFYDSVEKTLYLNNSINPKCPLTSATPQGKVVASIMKECSKGSKKAFRMIEVLDNSSDAKTLLSKVLNINAFIDKMG